MADQHGIPAFPLQWPAGWARAKSRQRARFDTPFSVARDGLVRELELMGARGIIISSNVPVRADGLPYADGVRRGGTDPGVAVYFRRKDHGMVFACDRWDSVTDNLQAIRLTVAALRGIERWGASDMMERAFTGFAALPPPAKVRTWREILGYAPNSRPSSEMLKQTFKNLALQHHPDRGGNSAMMAEINRAYDEALREIS